MNAYPRWTISELCLLAVALTFILAINGAVPFLAMPTLGQAIWNTGFAQSISNNSLFSIYAHDFGAPSPAAIAFGLAGAWPMSLLIRLGLHPADAYSGVVALWLGVAFYSAFIISRRLGAGRLISLLAAAAWLSMPVIWAHAGYSMLSTGIALLSFYFLATLNLLSLFEGTRNDKRMTDAFMYFSAAVLSVFMDGYTFMMFASGASILIVYQLLIKRTSRVTLMKFAVPAHIISFATAYFLYRLYIGKSGYEPSSVDFFRGWGLDISFLTIPTQGVFWIADLSGMSWRRSEKEYFGDSSVWWTSFALPILALGFLAWYRAKKQASLSSALLMIAILGFYMALGPSLKINSVKTAALQATPEVQVMPADAAIMSTGTAWVSTHIPGFNAMRASYRWIALCIFACWLLVVLRMSMAEGRQRHVWTALLLIVIVLNLPEPTRKWATYAGYRTQFQNIETTLVPDLNAKMKPNELGAFIPWGNDFFANYLSARSGFRTYNIGGDKNLNEAIAHWPSALLKLRQPLTPDAAPAVIKLLITQQADAIVIPYFDMLWSAHWWPCGRNNIFTSRQTVQPATGATGNLGCLSEQKQKLAAFLDELRKIDYLSVTDGELFVVVRLNDADSNQWLKIRKALLNRLSYPINVTNELENADLMLESGWHEREAHHVWSTQTAELVLPVPDRCASNNCQAVLKFVAFGVTPGRPAVIDFQTMSKSLPWHSWYVATTSDTSTVVLPLTELEKGQSVTITTPNATSPYALTGSADKRVLGIALQSVELLIDQPQTISP